MATNKIHGVAALISGFSLEDATIITLNDSMRCWSGAREYSHYTLNPETGLISWMTMPEKPVSEWTEQDVKGAYSFSAGKPGECCIDEPTVCKEFWRHNQYSWQNMLMYLHLVQDKCYDRYVRNRIITSRRYEDVYEFNGQTLSGSDLRGKGMLRWNGDGLLNVLDSQFYVRLAKMLYEATGVLANSEWLEREFKPAFFKTYSKPLAERTVPFISINPVADEVITQKAWDDEIWPVRNDVVDENVQWMLDDVQEALI